MRYLTIEAVYIYMCESTLWVLDLYLYLSISITISSIYLMYIHIFSNMWLGYTILVTYWQKGGGSLGKKTLYQHRSIPEEIGPIHTWNNDQVFLKNHRGVISEATVTKQIMVCLHTSDVSCQIASYTNQLKYFNTKDTFSSNNSECFCTCFRKVSF